MLGDFFLLVHHFLVKRLKLSFLLILFLLLFLGFGVSRLQIDQEIYSVLPQGKGFESLNKILDSKEINNKVFFSLNRQSDDDAESLSELLDSAGIAIQQAGGNYIKDITTHKDDVEGDVYNYYINNFPLLIDSNYYKTIDNKIQADSIKTAFSNTHRNLNSPGGGFLREHLLNDPIGITADFFKELENTYAKNQMKVENGIMYSKDDGSVFIYATLNNCTAVDKENLYKSLNECKSNWNKGHPNNKLDFFGSFQVHVENALQVKHDTLLTVGLTIIGILLVLVVYYRKVAIPIYFILPALFSGLFALGLIGYIRPTISGLSLGTGAVLIGILLNYSFHFFTHLRHTNSLEQTIKELSSPMLTGSLTTVLAFAALLYANSKMLNDFGLFASLALLGAAFFTITILPLVLRFAGFNFANLGKERFKIKVPSLHKKYHLTALVVVVIITIFMLFSAGKVEFDSDLSHLSYHKESVKQKEDKFVGINPDIDTKIFIFSTGRNLDSAAEVNYQILLQLKELRSAEYISNFYSTGDFLIPKKVKEEKKKQWNKFWESRASTTVKLVNSEARSYDFNENAFNDFSTWLVNTNDESLLIDTALLRKLELTNFINHDKNGEYSIITSIILSKKNTQFVKSKLSVLPGVVIFDRSDLATSLIDSVKDDFNFLLYISAAIVFITLLVVYGRMELTILAFLPMLVSWIWILGIIALLGIKFNFVNIIISTFIFGLGDDFSIFINDGLLSKYRSRSNALDSFKSAIFLSALTTLIGMGVLGFASHPAINSIALISVLGVFCIVIVSFIVQPIIFNLFVQSRVDSNKAPITLIELLLTIACFLFFLIGCIVSTIFLGVVLVIPFSKRARRNAINHVLSWFARIQIYAGFHVSKKFVSCELIDFTRPSIIIANHSSFLDILLVIMLSPKVVLVVKDWVYQSPLFGRLIRSAGYICIGNDLDSNLDVAKKLVQSGYSIAIFPEGSRSKTGVINRFHKGAFLLAKELHLDISPMMIHGASDVSSAGDFLIKKGKLTVKFLPRIKSNDPRWGADYSERTKSISTYFKQEYGVFKKERENAAYLYYKIFQNYVFKGPILEWYFKVKWKFESRNFEFYDSLIGDRKRIVDVGCGYGYLSYFLHYRNLTREILGLDYDEEKIQIAKHGYNLSEKVTFVNADITQFTIPACDVIFFNDILHYLTPTQQTELLGQCIHSLNPNGIIVVRDGITDLEARHRHTLRTEKYSTKILGFNKKAGVFNFFSSSFIKDLASENKLSYEMIEQSQKTSNVLFILRKETNGGE